MSLGSNDRAVDRQVSKPGAVDQVVNQWLNGQKYDRLLVDRPVNQKVKNDLFWLPTAIFLRAYIKGFSWAVFNKIFKELFFPSFKYLAASFKRVFEPISFIFYLFLKC